MDQGSTAPKARGASSSTAQAASQERGVGKTRLRETLRRAAGSGCVAQAAAELTVCPWGHRSGVSEESCRVKVRKSSSQSLPRIGLPAGKRSMASSSKVVVAGVVNLE